MASPGLRIKREGPAVLVLSGKPVEHAIKAENRREFVDRLFSISGVAGLALGPDHARLRFEPGAGSTPELLRRLAKAMRSEKVERFALADLELVEVLAPGERPIEIWRAGGRLTFLKVRALSPERYRFHHPEFRDPAARSAVLGELMGVAYLNEQIGSGRHGGFIEVEFQLGRMTIESLLGIMESALLGTIGSASRTKAQPFHFRGHLVDTNLALAVLSDFLFPPARLLSVVTLWMLNARHVRPSWRSLRNGKVNLDVLYTTIGCLTLLSLSFIASALMYWMFEFWPRRVKRLREAEVSRFLARMKRCPHSVWVDREGTEMEIERSSLRLGDTVILREGDVTPGDGVSLSGDIRVTESWTSGAHRKTAGDAIHCSGLIAGGEARMRLDTLGRGAAASKLAQWHAEAMLAPVSHERVKRLATSAVLPALALGAVAIMRGGVSMAKGVVRPDYVTGPLISRELGWVASAMEAAENGIFIGNESALEKLARCDCFIFGPGIAWRPGGREPEEIGQALRELGVEEILTPRAGRDESRALALLRKGIADERPVDTEGLIKERQYLGREVAFVGDCIACRDASSQADVAVHVSHPPFRERPEGEIVLLEPALEALLALMRIATGYNDRLRGSFATALIPNAACAIGALYFGMPILWVVALTNAGTLANYLQAGRALKIASRAGNWSARP